MSCSSHYNVLAVDCGVPRVKNDVLLIFNTTLEGSQLIFWCDQSPNDTKTASCLSDGRWNVVLDDYSCTGHGIHEYTHQSSLL